MANLLPFEQNASTLNPDYTAFAVDCAQASATAIAGRVTTGFSTGVYGQVHGPYPAQGLAELSLFGAVVGQTDLELINGVCGASVSGTGVSAISDSGLAVKATSNKGTAISASSGGDIDAIVSTTSSNGHAAVAAHNDGGGFGVWAYSKGGNAIAASSDSTTAGIDAIVSTTASPGNAAIAAHNNGGGFGLWASSMNNPGPEQRSVGGIGLYAEGYTYAAHFKGPIFHEGDHHCTGALTVDKDIALPASDCAEEFDIAPTAEVGPGTVMVLTDGGILKPSDNAYDKKVAGIISGAGDYRPGMILDRQGSSENRMPIALVGKVFCKVDAQYGPIEVGDMLTTSPTLGHAMKACDPALAFGAVLGKALRGLAWGQDMIPILVALQ